jgi:YVTN family beta-propeller protein
MRVTVGRLTAALAVLALVGTASAHGPTRQKVRESIEINAPPAKVWAVIGNFQGRGFVTDQYDGTVSVFDLASLAPIKRTTVGDYPEGIAATADGQRIIGRATRSASSTPPS